MTDAIRSVFSRISGVRCHGGVDLSCFQHLNAKYGLVLPKCHEELLRWSNGLEVLDGYYRLFGLGPAASIDALLWNDPEYWKFAWSDGRCADFWCFGESVVGDQLAYRISQLRRGEDAVYFLSAHTMQHRQVGPSFAGYMVNTFERYLAVNEELVRARSLHGPVPPDQHLAYEPPLALGGEAHEENMRSLPARLAMVLNADYEMQTTNPPAGRIAVEKVIPYEDDKGRFRVRLVWR
jgi:hypothetical protein